jgi:hypothetical protein
MSSQNKVSSAIDRLLSNSKTVITKPNQIIGICVQNVSPQYIYVQQKYECLNCLRMFKSEPAVKRHVRACYVEKKEDIIER